jgi:hypothetical protein
MARLLFGVPQGRFIMAEDLKVMPVSKNKGVTLPREEPWLGVR